MAALTSPRNTIELLPPVSYELEAASQIHAGALIARNADGKAVPAQDASGLIVLGRAENSASSGETVHIRAGVYLFDNGASSEALTGADIGKACYVLDDHTAGKLGGSNHVPAGIVMDVTGDGVAVIVSPVALKAAAAVTEDTNTTYGAATSAALGLVKQAAAVTDCTAAGDIETSVETQLNALLAALRTAGIIAAE